MTVRNPAVVVLLFAGAGTASAQSLPVYDGTYATIRTSSILPRKMPLFEKASRIRRSRMRRIWTARLLI